MKNFDTLQSFLFEAVNIRGYLVNLTDSYQTIIKQRPYPSAVKKFLGEAMVCAVFLASDMKFEGRLSLQFEGDERLPLIVVQVDNQLNIRAMAKYQESLSSEEYQRAFLNGKLSLTLKSPQSESYQSVVPINSSSMSANLMNYLTQSEQRTSQVWLAASEQEVAGMMLQLMPDKNPKQQEQFWEYAIAVGQTLKDEELLTLSNQTILHRLFHEVDLRLFDCRPTKFHCGCDESKMKAVIVMLGEKEAWQILKDQGHIGISCDFCNRSYRFDAVDTAALFHPKNLNRAEYVDPKVEIVKEIKAAKGSKSKK